jgi:hypothetical protein
MGIGSYLHGGRNAYAEGRSLIGCGWIDEANEGRLSLA